MTPEEFVKKYLPFARQCESETGVPAIAIMAQAALESGWGSKAIGNNLFGIKYKKGDYAYQKVLTTEYSYSQTAFKGAEIKSVEWDFEKKKYKYKVYQYFAEYPTPLEAFRKHSELLTSDRYQPAMKFKDDPKKYLNEVWKCGYATDPNYGNKMNQMVDSIVKRIK